MALALACKPSIFRPAAAYRLNSSSSCAVVLRSDVTDIFLMDVRILVVERASEKAGARLLHDNFDVTQVSAHALSRELVAGSQRTTALGLFIVSVLFRAFLGRSSSIGRRKLERRDERLLLADCSRSH